MTRRNFFAFIVLCTLLCLFPVSLGDVLGIDLGSEHFKVVLVRAGGMDIALNEASSRKSPVAVAIINGERYVGSPAQDLVRMMNKQLSWRDSLINLKKNKK